MPGDGLAALREYIEANKPTVVLDTNVLIHGSDNKPVHRHIGEACALLDVRICDTVYWEFLRNTNIEKFRDRRQFLSTWLKQNFLKETTIMREDEEVVKMHKRLYLLLLHFHPHAPLTVLGYLTPDLWIAAAAVQNLFDHVLTENVADFPPSLFEKVVTIGTPSAPASLLRFRRAEVKKAWLQLFESPAVELNLESSML